MDGEFLASTQFEKFLRAAKWPVVLYYNVRDAAPAIAELNKLMDEGKPTPMTDERIDFLMNNFYESRTDTFISFSMQDFMNFFAMPFANRMDQGYVVHRLNDFIAELMDPSTGKALDLVSLVNLNTILPPLLEEARKHLYVERIKIVEQNKNDFGEQVFIQNDDSGDYFLIRDTIKTDAYPAVNVYRIVSVLQFVRFVQGTKMTKKWDIVPSRFGRRLEE